MLQNLINSAVTEMDTSGAVNTMKQVGKDVGAGYAEGASDTTAVKSAMQALGDATESGLRSALASASPSKRMIPVGQDVVAGFAEGIQQGDVSGAMNAMGSNAIASARNALNAGSLRPIGYNAMMGMANGIRSGSSAVSSAMRSAAQAAVSAAKSELQIKSPSRVFRDEIGVMAMRGFGEGVLRETKAQQRVISNASRYLTSAAREGTITPTLTTNHNTYNSSSSINFDGSNFYVNDQQDVYALAVEIASIVKRQQRGKGLRMA